MTAQGKINASKVQIGDRIIVRDTDSNFSSGYSITCSHTKTGETVRVARVTGKSAVVASNGRRAQRWYKIETTEGSFEAAPIQTMFLAPEDAAGIKRARVEALAEDAERAEKAELSSGNAAVDAWCEANDADAEQERLERVAAEERATARLEAPVEPEKADPYWTKGPGVQVLQRDAELAAGAFEVMHSMCTVDNHDGCISPEQALPQREPGRALVEELLGEDVDQAMGLPDASEADAAAVVARHAKPLAVQPRIQVLLRPLGAEVMERASRHTFGAVGAEWGALEGRRVRIACMDGDVFHQRPLMLLEAGERELDWKNAGDTTINGPQAIMVGGIVLVDGCRVYRVTANPIPGYAPVLTPVK